jgi:hypothetical protein
VGALRSLTAAEQTTFDAYPELDLEARVTETVRRCPLAH